MIQKKHGLQTNSKWDLYLYGGISCCLTETLLIPFDVLKVRMQIHNQKLQTTSLFSKTREIYQEGFTSFFKGLSPSLLRQITYGTLRIGLYGSFKSLFSDPENLNFKEKLFCGFCSGAIAAGVCSPIDLVKIRIQTNSQKSNSLLTLLRSIYQENKLKGFYRGYGITILRASVVNSTSLGGYEQVKNMIIRSNRMKDDIYCHFISSIISSFFSCLISSPFDFIRTRMMNQVFEKTIFKTSFHCFKYTLKNEGFWSLFQGFIPSYLRYGSSSVIGFIILEKLLKLRN